MVASIDNFFPGAKKTNLCPLRNRVLDILIWELIDSTFPY
jgi:hypothetical protein